MLMTSSSPLFVKMATPFGTYHKSPASRSALRHYLRGCATTTFKSAADDRRFWESDDELRRYMRGVDFAKQAAGIGGDPEQGFESAFSSLAYAYLKDKAPRLLDYIVGFQLVDRNEDNTKAMGVFGFKVGEQWIYAPVFFLNGDLKGHELCYIKKQDMFVPLKENWINYIISRQPHTLGEASDKNTFQLGGLMPNLSRMSRTPMGTKYGSAELPIRVDAWAAPAMPLLCAMMTKQASAFYPGLPQLKGKTLEFKNIVERPFKAALAMAASSFDLGNALRANPGLLPALEKCASGYPLIKEGLDRFYGKDFLPKMRTELAAVSDSLVTRAKQAASYILPPSKSRGRTVKGTRFNLDLVADNAPDKGEKEAEILVYALDVDNDVPITVNDELTDADREKLLKDTILIKDKRDPHSDRASIAYNTQVRLELLNPGETGLYSVLEKPGEFSEMLVISAPASGRGTEDFSLVVRKSDPRSWLNAHRNNLWAKSCDCPVRADFVRWVEGLGGVESLKKGGTYIAIHENGTGSCPFTVQEDYGDGSYRVNWHDQARRNMRKLHREEKNDWDYDSGYEPWSALLHVNKTKGCKLRTQNGEMHVPDSFKIITVQDPPKPKKTEENIFGDCSPCAPVDNTHSETEPIAPGNLVDVQTMLHKSAKTLKLQDVGGNEMWINAEGSPAARMSKKAMLIHLVKDHGLRESQARIMLKEAEAKAVFREQAVYFIKHAYGYGSPDLSGGPNAPAFPMPEMGTEQIGPNAVPAIYPQEELLPIDGMSSQQTDPQIYDPFFMPDRSAMQTAQQASAAGQKEVFDTSMLGGLLKNVRQDTVIDKYLGDLMKALDKLGRLLFMFYWHQEEFQDRYGKQDLPEMEDSIRNTFDSVGDLTLFLKKKSVKGQSGVDMGSGSGVGHEAEPSIDEVARN